MMTLRTLARPSLRRTYRTHTSHVATELLEDRVVLSAAAAVAPAPALQAPLAEVTDVVVNSVEVVEGQLIANATVIGNVLGTAFSQDVQIPITAGATDGGTGACDILNLSLGPVSLNVLGLNVNLDNCDGGPVTVDITGNTGDGNLLGNLVCDIAGLADDGGLLDLSGLTGDQLATLTSGVTDVLNGVFDRLLGSAGGGTASAAAAAQAAGSTDILNLHLDPIDLNLLGLEVQTSAICLDVTADSGNGNLLGNLLGSIAHLLDRNPGNAINALVNRAERLLGSLNLADVSDSLLASQGNGKRG